MSLSTHVLDTAAGQPAAGVPVRLDRGVRTLDGDIKGWRPVTEAVTDNDGRIRDLPADQPGPWRLVFDTAARSPFFPEVTVAFTISDPTEHHHVPLLLSPHGYTTYRGS